ARSDAKFAILRDGRHPLYHCIIVEPDSLAFVVHDRPLDARGQLAIRSLYRRAARIILRSRARLSSTLQHGLKNFNCWLQYRYESFAGTKSWIRGWWPSLGTIRLDRNVGRRSSSRCGRDQDLCASATMLPPWCTI